MAGGPGYYLVSLANGSAGVAKTPANKHPTSVGGSSVVKSVYLGASRQDVVANWKRALSDIYPYALGLRELPPAGAESAIIGSGTDLGTILDHADKYGSGILAKTTGNAEADPTFTIIAGGLGGVLGEAVSAAAEGADAAATAGGEASGAAAGTASGIGAGTAAKLATGGIAGLLGASGDWETLAVRALEALAGGALILLGLQALTGTGDGNPVKAVRKAVRV